MISISKLFFALKPRPFIQCRSCSFNIKYATIRARTLMILCLVRSSYQYDVSRETFQAVDILYGKILKYYQNKYQEKENGCAWTFNVYIQSFIVVCIARFLYNITQVFGGIQDDRSSKRNNKTRKTRPLIILHCASVHASLDLLQVHGDVYYTFYTRSNPNAYTCVYASWYLGAFISHWQFIIGLWSI